MKSKKKITFGIIGYGRFGKLWAKSLSRHGAVFVFDKINKIQRKGTGLVPANLEQTVSADIVFLCVPISEMASACKAIRPLISRETLVVDVCSVKMFALTVMKKFLPKNQPILATHPLFGPDSEKINKGLHGLKIVVCKASKTSAHEKTLLGIFKKLKLKVIFTSPEKHDRQMATSQALVHFIGRGLAKLELKPQEISTPDYNSLVRMHQMVNNDTWQLFLDMQNKNSFAGEARERFLRNLKKLDDAMNPAGENLVGLRKKINRVDGSIIELLALRLKIVKKIGTLKRQKKLRVLDRGREKDLSNLHRKYSKRNKIDAALTDKIFDLIVNHSKTVQRKKR
ncbi:MAG: prephenate dehydrogenase/arogenate dehydrogenase family protein [bacterium]|nr:prephenate dehydrogenase/arogenate dehydrogenase family protein [bacterium]